MKVCTSGNSVTCTHKRNVHKLVTGCVYPDKCIYQSDKDADELKAELNKKVI